MGPSKTGALANTVQRGQPGGSRHLPPSKTEPLPAPAGLSRRAYKVFQEPR